MDTQTRHALKKDKFAQAAADSASWLSGHRSGVLRWVVVGVVILVLGVGGLVFWTMRSSASPTPRSGLLWTPTTLRWRSLDSRLEMVFTPRQPIAQGRQQAICRCFAKVRLRCPRGRRPAILAASPMRHWDRTALRKLS